MIGLNDVLNIHDILIDKFGGTKGVRDQGALESAINRPYATFGELDLYSSQIEKAAAIFESVLINHPFLDDNKRTAYVLMKLILLEDGLAIYADQDEKYQMVISASKGDIRFAEIVKWLQNRVKKKFDA
jgi:death-on-curing protein